jgi:hypothetical protein
MENMQNN